MLKSTIRDIRQLIDGERLLALAVVADGAPYAGLLPYAVVPGQAAVLIHASKMSKHSQGLVDGGRVGVLIHAQDGPEQDPLQIRRASFECLVRPYERRSEAWLEARGWYLARFAQSGITFNLGDFTLYRLEFERGLYVAGFGRASEIEPEDIGRLGAASAGAH